MKLYTYVSRDKFELPLVVADSVVELARRLGIKSSTANEFLSRERHGKSTHKCRFREINVEPAGKVFQGSILKDLRTASNLKIDNLSKDVNISCNMIRKYEDEGKEPLTRDLFVLADYFGIDVDEFFREVKENEDVV